MGLAKCNTTHYTAFEDLSTPAWDVTTRISRGLEHVPRVLLYTSARLLSRRRTARRVTSCRHESAALGARIGPWPIDVYRIHFINTSLATGDADDGSIGDSCKHVGESVNARCDSRLLHVVPELDAQRVITGRKPQCGDIKACLLDKG